MDKSFVYENTEITKKGGAKTIRKVSIKNGKGYKMVSKYNRGKHVGTSKKPIHESDLSMICVGKFVKGLFNDCKCGADSKRKTRKNRQ